MHEPIDQRVVDIFSTSISRKLKVRSINYDQVYAPQKAGRCEDGVDMCPCCGSIFVDTDGFIHQCGCDDAPAIGSVMNPDEFVNNFHKYDFGECWKGLHNPDINLVQPVMA